MSIFPWHAKPKSASLTVYVYSKTRKFSNFMSLWVMFLSCRYSNALAICRNIERICIGSRTLGYICDILSNKSRSASSISMQQSSFFYIFTPLCSFGLIDIMFGWFNLLKIWNSLWSYTHSLACLSFSWWRIILRHPIFYPYLSSSLYRWELLDFPIKFN